MVCKVLASLFAVGVVVGGALGLSHVGPDLVPEAAASVDTVQVRPGACCAAGRLCSLRLH